jgi:hypothetical protein
MQFSLLQQGGSAGEVCDSQWLHKSVEPGEGIPNSATGAVNISVRGALVSQGWFAVSVEEMMDAPGMKVATSGKTQWENVLPRQCQPHQVNLIVQF